MIGFLTCVLLLSVLFWVIGFISPKTISKWLRINFSRKKVFGVFGSLFFGSVVALATVLPPVSSNVSSEALVTTSSPTTAEIGQVIEVESPINDVATITQGTSTLKNNAEFQQLNVSESPAETSSASSAVVLSPMVSPSVNTQANLAPPQNTAPSSDSGLSNNNYYTNSAGNSVHSPAYETQKNVVPAGASARCGDGTYSFSQSRRGTCSHHGGVDEWL